MKLLTRKWVLPILLTIWAAWETIGGVERFYSGQINNYIRSTMPDIENPVGALIGNAPLFIFICIAIASLFILLLYKVSNNLIRRKRVPIIIKYVIIGLWVAGIALNIKNIFNNSIEMLKWKFYISALSGIPVVAYSILILTSFYFGLRDSAEKRDGAK